MKTATKNKISKVIDLQLSKHHEWLPHQVVGESGLRPFDVPTDGQDVIGKKDVMYSREGVKSTMPFTSKSDVICVGSEVKEEEWEVRKL